MPMSNSEMIIGSGAVRARALPRMRENFKGLKTGFSCGLGNPDCEMFKNKERYLNSLSTVANNQIKSMPGSAVGGLRSADGNAGFGFSTGPLQVTGNNQSALFKAVNADPDVTSANAQKSVLTANSNLTRITNNRVVGADYILSMRNADMENFRGNTFFPEDEMEPFLRTGNIMDYSKENFNNRCSRENMTRRTVSKPQFRNKMIEQYITKIPATKGGGLRAQYGLK